MVEVSSNGIVNCESFHPGIHLGSKSYTKPWGTPKLLKFYIIIRN